MNTDLELYRVFCEVVKYKNISKTAESMYVSQSAITQSIQKLESLLGGKVFYRNKNGVELTEEGITDILMQKLANGELDIVALNLPFKDKKYSNIEIIPLKKSTFCFFASKDYIKKNPIKNFKELKNNTLILPKAPSSKKKILDDFCKKENIELVANYEVSSTSIMKRLVLNDIGIGFTNIENLKDIEDKITIINKIEIEDTKEGIATLKKNMSNKATIELVKEIKQYYKRN